MRLGSVANRSAYRPTTPHLRKCKTKSHSMAATENATQSGQTGDAMFAKYVDLGTSSNQRVNHCHEAYEPYFTTKQGNQQTNSYLIAAPTNFYNVLLLTQEYPLLLLIQLPLQFTLLLLFTIQSQLLKLVVFRALHSLLIL